MTSSETTPVAPPDPAATPPERRAPRSAWQMAWVFNRLALQGFGGVLPVAQRELVERERWLGKDEFLALLSLGQVLPGPNIVNMALIIGQRFHGMAGAVASLAGLMLMPLVIVMTLAVMAGQFNQHPQVAGALRGMGVVASGLVLATAARLMAPLKRSVLGLPLALTLGAATFVAIGVLRWPLVAVVTVLGPLGIALAWSKLGAGTR